MCHTWLIKHHFAIKKTNTEGKFMSEPTNKLVIENEYLFRALICGPAALSFGALSQHIIVNNGFGFLNLFFVLLTLFFTLSALGYAALYTNDRYEGRAPALFTNQNLAKTVIYLPLAVLFVLLTLHSIEVSSSLFFNLLYGVIALACVLATLGYASHYTNDYFEQNALTSGH